LAETDIILAEVAGLSRAEQIIFDSPCPEKWRKQAMDILDQREKKIPLQYVIGHTQFMGLKFRVEPGVFIPRADTEVVVETAIDILRRERFQQPYVMDIGTGSGAIAVALAKNLPEAKVLACEIAEIPFRVAMQNARFHQVEARIEFVNGNWRENVPLDLDMIVSNPPYIPRNLESTLASEVVMHEPHLALFGDDEDGLSYYREMARLTRTAFNKLEGGWFVCELGDNQATECVRIFQREGWHEISVIRDLSGTVRVLSARSIERYLAR